MAIEAQVGEFFHEVDVTEAGEAVPCASADVGDFVFQQFDAGFRVNAGEGVSIVNRIAGFAGVQFFLPLFPVRVLFLGFLFGDLGFAVADVTPVGVALFDFLNAGFQQVFGSGGFYFA